MGILSFSGGLGSLAADLATEAGLTLPILAEETQEKLAGVLPDYAPKDNPVDLVSLMVSKPESQPLKTAGEAVAGDENVDALLFMMGVYHHVGDQIAAEVEALFEASPVPVAFAWLTGPREQIQNLRKASVPRIRRLRPRDSRTRIPPLAQERARGGRLPAPLGRPRRGRRRRGVSYERVFPLPTAFFRPRPVRKFSISTASRDPKETLVETSEEALKTWEKV